MYACQVKLKLQIRAFIMRKYFHPDFWLEFLKTSKLISNRDTLRVSDPAEMAFP